MSAFDVELRRRPQDVAYGRRVPLHGALRGWHAVPVGTPSRFRLL